MRQRKRIRMLLERPRRVCNRGCAGGRLVSWADFKAECRREDLEAWAEDEKIPPRPREGHLWHSRNAF